MTTLLIITQNITCNWRYDNHSNKSGGPISTFVDEGYDHVTSRREPLTPFPSYDQHLPTLRTSVLAVRCFSFNLRI